MAIARFSTLDCLVCSYPIVYRWTSCLIHTIIQLGAFALPFFFFIIGISLQQAPVTTTSIPLECLFRVFEKQRLLLPLPL